MNGSGYRVVSVRFLFWWAFIGGGRREIVLHIYTRHRPDESGLVRVGTFLEI